MTLHMLSNQGQKSHYLVLERPTPQAEQRHLLCGRLQSGSQQQLQPKMCGVFEKTLLAGGEVVGWLVGVRFTASPHCHHPKSLSPVEFADVIL